MHICEYEKTDGSQALKSRHIHIYIYNYISKCAKNEMQVMALPMITISTAVKCQPI